MKETQQRKGAYLLNIEAGHDHDFHQTYINPPEFCVTHKASNLDIYRISLNLV